MNTQENNKLIAEFMGYSQPHPNYPNTTYWFKEGEEPLALLSFDRDWNWLMEVVDKIESLSYVVGRHFVLRTESAYVQFIVDRMNIEPFAKWGTCGGGENKKIAVYNACVEFIKWYNEQK